MKGKWWTFYIVNAQYIITIVKIYLTSFCLREYKYTTSATEHLLSLDKYSYNNCNKRKFNMFTPN